MVTEREAYRAGLARYQVQDGGRLRATHIRCSVRDGAFTVFVGSWHDAYRQRRRLAAEHAAELLGCRERLDTDMQRAPIDQTWLRRLVEACRSQTTAAAASGGLDRSTAARPSPQVA